LIERPGHWGAIISDSTGPIGQDTVEYFLRSELLACIILLRRQMNKTIWKIRDTGPRKFVGWELDVKDGPVNVGTFKKYSCFAI
jgi:hypothetical protein